ncbi:MAG: toll/interleukin-1 receptor domain-containing protein [Verrucomicrobia bacterium]|nr:toll/interleukin-1 receptor domain-containing protein [Verrucomicrobiota bacterium]
MAHEVFISHSRQDKATADAVCHRLEAKGIRCWMAPRDVPAGADWSESILCAIDACRLLVVVFSDHANESRHVRIEVAQAFKRELTIIPFRIEQTAPQGSLQYYLDAVHWLDALTPPLERHLDELAERVGSLISCPKAGRPTVPAAQAEEADRAQASTRVNRAEVEGKQPRAMPTSLSRKAALALLFLLLIVAGTYVWFTFGLPRAGDHPRPSQGGRAALPTPSAPMGTAPDVLTFDTMAVGALAPDVFVDRGVRFVLGKGKPGIYPSEPNMVLPPGRRNVLLLAGERVTSLTIAFISPIKRFSLTRIGTAGGSSVPSWTLDAFDGAGKIVGSAGEEHGLPKLPQQFSVAAGGIARVQLSTDNRFGEGTWATWNGLPVVELVIEH